MRGDWQEGSNREKSRINVRYTELACLDDVCCCGRVAFEVNGFASFEGGNFRADVDFSKCFFAERSEDRDLGEIADGSRDSFRFGCIENLLEEIFVQDGEHAFRRAFYGC